MGWVGEVRGSTAGSILTKTRTTFVPATASNGAMAPAAVDWRDVNNTGVNLCTRVQNQFLPSGCGWVSMR